MFKAVQILAALPAITQGSQLNLESSLKGFVVKEGLMEGVLGSAHLSMTLKENAREHLEASDLHQLQHEIAGLHIGATDIGASVICPQEESRFIPGTCVVSTEVKKLGGIAGGLKIAGKGICQFQMATRKGKVQKATRPASHVPDISMDLIPPLVVARNRKDGWLKINGEQAMFEFANGGHVNVGFDPMAKLPMVHFSDNADKAAQDLETALHSCVAEEANQNLSPGQKRMLRWHFCLSHKNIALIKWLARRGLLGQHSKKIGKVSDGDHPMCASFNCGKQKRSQRRAN